jgi:hypothetical protein
MSAIAKFRSGKCWKKRERDEMNFWRYKEFAKVLT